eukprot:366160-Chlamydomonas_euryale.AAC.3
MLKARRTARTEWQCWRRGGRRGLAPKARRMARTNCLLHLVLQHGEAGLLGLALEALLGWAPGLLCQTLGHTPGLLCPAPGHTPGLLGQAPGLLPFAWRSRLFARSEW